MDNKKEYKEHLSVWRMLQSLVLIVLAAVAMITHFQIETLEQRIEALENSQKRMVQTMESITDVLEVVAKKR